MNGYGLIIDHIHIKIQIINIFQIVLQNSFGTGPMLFLNLLK